MNLVMKIVLWRIHMNLGIGYLRLSTYISASTITDGEKTNNYGTNAGWRLIE